MKITMYELLGMVKDGKAPKKIKYKNKFYYLQHYCNGEMDYINEDNLDEIYHLFNEAKVNDEVEILEEKEICHKCHKYPAEYNQTYCEFCLGISKLEEEKKIPEKLEIIEDGGDTGINDEYMSYKQFRVVSKKINEIIDYLKSKGDE